MTNKIAEGKIIMFKRKQILLKQTTSLSLNSFAENLEKRGKINNTNGAPTITGI